MNDNDLRVSNEIGGLTLAVLTGVDTTKYRATATFLDTGGSQICTFTPSGGHGEMPLEGSLCAVYRKGQFFCQFIKELNDFTAPTDLSVEQRLQSGSEITVGSAPRLESGEMYIGRLGRAVFDNSGGVNISTQMGNMSMRLSDKAQRAYLTGNNITLSTPDTGIRVITASSGPAFYGDSIRIEKNVPLPYMTPDELNTFVSPADLVPSLAYIQIDEFNAITANVLVPGPALYSRVSLGELGDAAIGNVLGYFQVDPTGGVTVSSDKNVGIGALLAATITGNRPGFNVLLNPNLTPAECRGVARVDDPVISSSMDDAEYWLYTSQLHATLLALCTALTTWTVVPLDGGAGLKAAVTAALAIAVPPVVAPSELMSHIQFGSSSVTAGD